ncbi:MAG: phosphoribosylaminoimidazolesuccinocarboxamide synthase [Acidobacteria bacterium]|nr:phosphoribosylaminoimidazolesuccinocarboxamide synthase [Acidobacteriota bacterium]
MNLHMKELELAGVRKVSSGKVREMFEVGEHLLMVATDRISAFDVVLPNTIPQKGKVLTQISAFWFKRLEDVVSNHLISSDVHDLPESLSPYRNLLRGRSMLVRRCRPLPIECVVRGYLAGSGWSEYRRTQSICGIRLPAGLRESDKLPEPIFTPATKATTGHDENISYERVVEMVGKELAEKALSISLELYRRGQEHAYNRGIIICDTKFEFGLSDSQLILIDEVLTPDSSRFWPADQYEPGRAQPSFDKQFIRDYLESLNWDKTPPAPELPPEVIEATSRRYVEAFRRITGLELT